MKKISKDSGANEKAKVDYFELMRTSEPVESYGIKELKKKIEAERKRKIREAGKKG